VQWPATNLEKLLIRKGLKAVGGLHRVLYRASGGRVGGRVWGLSILLLTTTGRKTGKLRTTPLCFLPAGDDLVVVASNGGMDWFPSWWLNLLQDPRATVQVGRTRRAVTAREATPEERARLWVEVTTIAPGYLKYQQRTRREIPLGILQSDQVAASGSREAPARRTSQSENTVNRSTFPEDAGPVTYSARYCLPLTM
jgi:deazaflavin-dependent oxidoreductase (nitroreductase family)